MNTVKFAEFLVTKLTKESDLIKVKEFETEKGLILQILVSDSMVELLEKREK